MIFRRKPSRAMVVIAMTVLVASLITAPAGAFTKDIFTNIDTIFNSPSSVTIPSLINYQGYLTDSGGNPIDGTVGMTFSIYDVPAGGSPVWQETQSSVSVTDGLFNVLLGIVNPLNADYLTGSSYLGITVNPDPEMTPRQQIVSVAYAIIADQANNAATLNGGVLREGSTAQGVNWDTHVNLGVDSVTGNVSTDASYSTVGGGETNVAGGSSSTISGGRYNAVSGYASSIGGGEGNTISGNYGAVSGGGDNDVTGDYATTGGGKSNTAGNDYAVVGGGLDNLASTHFTVIGGGASNIANGTFSIIGGGYYNRTHGDYSVIAGGGPSDLGNPTTSNNHAYDNYGVVGGGGGNVAGNDDADPGSAQFATVGGGKNNTAGAEQSTVSGGGENTAGGYSSLVGGGIYNSADGGYSTVGGGINNIAGNQYSTVAGGNGNTASGTRSTIGGGQSNIASGAFSTVSGGVFNTAGGDYSWAGGSNMQLTADADRTFVWGYSPVPMIIPTGDSFLIFPDFNSGKVGIGISTPEADLHVHGDMKMTMEDPVHLSGIDVSDWQSSAQGLSDLIVSGDYAYHISDANNFLMILDVSDPENPTYVGGTTSQLLQPQSLCRSGNYIYIAGKSEVITGNRYGRVTVIDISDPTHPNSVSEYVSKFGGSLSDLHYLTSIFISGPYAYVTSPYGDGGVEIIDISDPYNLLYVGSITDNATTLLNGASDICVVGRYAYVASNEDDGVEILDISDPFEPVHVGAFSDNPTTALDGARSIHVVGNYAYVASEIDNGVEILDVSDPANPTHVGAIFDTLETALDSACDIQVAGNYAYIASNNEAITSSDDGAFEILDISDPSNPVHVHATFNGTSAVDLTNVEALYVSGSKLYVGVGNKWSDNMTSKDPPEPGPVSGVEIYDLGGMEIPAAEIGSLHVSQLEVTDTMIVDNTLYVEHGLNVGPGGIQVGEGGIGSEGDIKLGGDDTGIEFPDGHKQTSAAVNPSQIALNRWYTIRKRVTDFPVGNNPQGIVFDGAHMWVANEGDDTVTKIRAADGLVIDTYSVGDGPCDLVFDGKFIWVTNQNDDTVTQLYASDGTVNQTYSTGNGPCGIAFNGGGNMVINQGDNTLHGIPKDPENTGTLDATPTDIIYDDNGWFWITTYDGTISKLLGRHFWDDDNNLYFDLRIPLPDGPHSMVFDGVHIWVASAGDEVITKVRAADGVVLGEYRMDPDSDDPPYYPIAIAYDGINIWVANRDARSITIVDTYDGSMSFYDAGGTPAGLAFDGVNIWVTLSDQNEVRKL